MPTKIVPVPKPTEGAYIYKHNPCYDKDHNPPSHIVIPHGHMLVHTCPSCGNSITIGNSEITFYHKLP